MNIAKKLLFSLLLCGSVFAAACGEEGAGKNETCSSSVKCAENLDCIVETDGADEGTCQDACSSDNCASPKSCQPGTKKVKGATEAPQVCADPGTNDQKAQEGRDCSAASGKQCDTGLVCVSDLCQPSCTTVGSADAVCTAHDTKKECVEENSVKYCKAPSTKKGEDEACTAADTCDDNLVCAGPNGSKTCQPSCTTVGLADTVCKELATKVECFDDNGTKYCKVPAPVADGGTCTNKAPCATDLSCIPANDGDEEGTCTTTCVDTACTGGQTCKPGDKKVKGATEAPKTCQA